MTAADYRILVNHVHDLQCQLHQWARRRRDRARWLDEAIAEIKRLNLLVDVSEKAVKDFETERQNEDLRRTFMGEPGKILE